MNTLIENFEISYSLAEKDGEAIWKLYFHFGSL